MRRTVIATLLVAVACTIAAQGQSKHPFGMPSADTGVKMAPAVVPSWRDIGPRSEYVKHLYDKALPEAIEYSLFFAFNENDADDTVVALNSQLRKEARLEADYLGAFQNTHTGVLKDQETCAALKRTFAR